MYSAFTYGWTERRTFSFRPFDTPASPPIKSRRVGNGGVRLHEGESIDSGIRRFRRLLEKTRVTADTRRAYARYETPSARRNKLMTRKKRTNKKNREGTLARPTHTHYHHR